jgi:membrane-associated phospholipid phosphatase
LAYAIGRLIKRDALADAALVFAAAGFWSFAITGIGQFVLDDMRPREGGALHWFGIHGHGVSGHASAASLLMSPGRYVFARDKSRLTQNILGLGLGAWALFIGWSRIYLGMHHTWNVVLGLAIGFACASAATKAFVFLRASE